MSAFCLSAPWRHMTSLFYRLYPKDATIPDHTVNPAARWAKVVAHGGDTKAAETDEDDQESSCAPLVGIIP